MIAWTLFYSPVPGITDLRQLVLLLPLLLSIALVYKTVRTQNLRRLPLETLSALAYMVCGLAVLGAVLWGVIAFLI